jgi:LmbE family N-acetylglucosaminyl deacetylase
VSAATTPALVGPGRHLVAVVAHPDDETFGCGSILAAAAAAGATVTVICGTRGEAGERVPDPATEDLPLGAVRERELHDAARVLGVDRVELLDHHDSDFDGPPPDGALVSVPVEQLADDLAGRFDALAPDVVVILDGGDGHRDHLHVRAAVESVIASGRYRGRVVMSCLPNGLMRRWVAEMRAEGSGGAYVDLDLDSLGTPDDLLTALPAEHVLEVREEAIARHRSQRSPFEDLSPELRREFLGTDHVMDLVVAPAG